MAVSFYGVIFRGYVPVAPTKIGDFFLSVKGFGKFFSGGGDFFTRRQTGESLFGGIWRGGGGESAVDVVEAVVLHLLPAAACYFHGCA